MEISFKAASLTATGNHETKHRGKKRSSSKSLIRNLSYKAILGHTWISEFCPEADLVVKADDDFMVDLPLLR